MLTRKQQFRRLARARPLHPSDVEYPTPAPGLSQMLGVLKGNDSLRTLQAKGPPRAFHDGLDAKARRQQPQCIPGRSGNLDQGVRFACQINVILVPTRQELATGGKEALWWSSLDYTLFQHQFVHHMRKERAEAAAARADSADFDGGGNGDDVRLVAGEPSLPSKARPPDGLESCARAAAPDVKVAVLPMVAY